MIKKSIRIKTLPASLLFVVLETEGEDYINLAEGLRSCGTVARTIDGEGGHVLIILDTVKYPVTLSMIPHEVTHAVDYIEEYINQESPRASEYKAYLIGYLNEMIYTIMLDNGYKISKVKKEYLWTKGEIIVPDNETVSKIT